LQSSWKESWPFEIYKKLLNLIEKFFSPRGQKPGLTTPLLARLFLFNPGSCLVFELNF
jgi:hypothetical protein